ncbi:hypothetical protein BJ508DRAFT_308775 [Ascobolus immersus RN42]|uniref:CENP-V/GFA domain-containing protein n=1 Tax=Ascobolus immersus RN42 TaxID=1160509 RepID=A0A3N4I0W2_ASCIM|nr:hypothetical protein BJ508DRAFT_308775 [Ascobolus immersus RN42]
MASTVPSTTTPPSNPTSHTSGGCHCGTIRYTLTTSLTPSTVVRCSCTHCFKHGKLAHLLSDESLPTLTLLSPLPSGSTAPLIGAADIQAALATDELKEKVGGYQYGKKVMTHYFCRGCGVHTFTIHVPGVSPFAADGGLRVGINVNAVDGLDMSGEEWKVVGGYLDGRGDFKQAVGKVPYGGGSW